MWEYIQPVFALLVLVVVVRYILLGRYTTEEISTYIKNGTMRTISIIGVLMLISFFIWLMYTAFTSDYESDVCGFITSSDCN
jgi:formate hydrogenlyase subunit 4